MSVGNATVVESPTRLVPASVVVSVSAPLSGAECVWFHTVDGTATGAARLTKHDGTQDYRSKAGKFVKIAAGKTRGVIATTVNYDTTVEGNETYTVVLDKTTAASPTRTCISTDPQDPNVTIGRPVATVTILDNNPSAPRSVSVGDVAVMDGNTAVTAARLSIGLSAPLSGAECVWFHTVDGTATGAAKLTKHDGTQDYQSKSGKFVKIAAGKTNGVIVTTVNYDTALEGDENYTVVLDKTSAASPTRTCISTDPQDPNVTIGRGTGTVTILTSFAYANLTGANLVGFDLTNADLTDANLTDANLTDANLTSAALAGATLTGADLTGVRSGSIVAPPAALPTGWQLINGYLVGPGANLTNANLTNADLTGTDLTGATLTGVFSGGITGNPTLPTGWQLINGYLVGPGAHLTHANLAWIDLNGVDLSGVDLSGADVHFVTLINANLTNADMTGADLTGANLTNANLTNADLTGAHMFGVTLVGADLSGADLTGANPFAVSSGGITGNPTLPTGWQLINGYLIGPGAGLNGADLTGADLTGATLTGAFLEYANLTDANLTGADLTGVSSGGITGSPTLPTGWQLINGYLIGPGARLSGADLSGADLTGADLTGVISGGVSGNPTLPSGWQLINGYLMGPGANLTDADLANTVLSGVNLSNANLNTANLTNTTLIAVDLTGATLIQATVTGVVWLSTTCPDGSNSDDNAGTCLGHGPF